MSILPRDLGQVLADAPDLVAMSALLDLVSRRWLERLGRDAGVRRLSALCGAELSTAASTLTPASRHDAAVIAAVNRHQLTDKGFGPALGPERRRRGARTLPRRRLCGR